ncbi:hypothetical protein KCP77_06880 [Salmonella enterica subsp. enterica]|nr:hypothetical protein KCP77_06880 [Salmonella enterica subsp. enterica]
MLRFCARSSCFDFAPSELLLSAIIRAESSRYADGGAPVVADGSADIIKIEAAFFLAPSARKNTTSKFNRSPSFAAQIVKTFTRNRIQYFIGFPAYKARCWRRPVSYPT